MHFDEPMTMATDYLLAVAGLWLGVRLHRAGDRTGQLAPRLWGLAFGLSALAALVGGSVHGFRSQLSLLAYRAGWQVIYHAIVAAGFLMLAGTLRARLTPAWQSRLLVVAGLKLVVVVAWLQAGGAFKLVVGDYLIAMLWVLALELRALLKGDAAARWIVVGLAVSFVAAGLQLAHVGFGPGFNHNDLYHVIQIGALVLLARGGELLRDR